MANTADRAGWDAYLFELPGSVHDSYAAEAPYLSLISGAGNGNPGRINTTMPGGRDIFSGSQVRHTVDLSALQSGGWPGESGTWNAPSAASAKKIYDTLKDFVQPISVTVDVERDSFNHSNAQAVTRLFMKAAQATAMNENVAFLGDGTGVVATVTDTSSDLDTDVTGANFDLLLPGTIWDILTSAGADTGQGLRRKIASVSITDERAGTGTITWDTNATASDGGSGNIGHANTDLIVIPGSFSVPGTTDYAPNGLLEAAAGTGTTFQGLSKTTYPQWRGVDGRNGVSTQTMLSEAMLRAGARLGRRFGTNAWDFGIGDPAAIDGFVISYFAQRMYEPDTMEFTTGASSWAGVKINGVGTKPFPLISDPAHKKAAVHLLVKGDIQLYGDQAGPSWLDDDGARFRRFSRALPKEAELVDRVEQFFTRCCSIVKFYSLDVAAAA